MTTNDKYIVALIKNYLSNQEGYYISLLNEELETIKEIFEEYEIDFTDIKCAKQREKSELIEI